MTRVRPEVVLPLGLVLATLSAVEPAAAYILPAEAILGSITRRREQIDFKSLVLEGFRRRGNSDSAEEKIWEVVVPGKGARQESKGVDGATTVVLTIGQKRWTFKQGERAAASRIKPSLVIAFLGNTDRGSAERGFLDAYGIDADTVSLARLDGQVAYVIGAKPWEPTKPQVWIDKSFRVPVRLIEVDPKTKEVTDTRLLGFGSATTGEWWPRQIEIWKNGQLIETTTYTEVKVNEPVDPALLKPLE
ncbi:MAG: hypothetical protein IT384_00915 [Deltaproteobacteria bacterium]|nr:hypothetical protein [Deltaproteobacteria bacterium]